MSDIKKLDFISSPIKKFDLKKNYDSNLKLLELRNALKIDLRSDIKDQSISKLKSKNRSFEVSRAAFFLGFAATLVVTVVVLILAQVIFADLNTSIRALLVWVVAFGFTYVGYSTLRKMSKEKFELLHSNGQPIFRTLDMKARWSSFYDWAEEHDISFFVIEKDGYGHVTDSDFWKLDHNEIFILGDDDHRSKLMKDARQLTSHLYIQKSDWDDFLQLSKVPAREIPNQETFLEVSTGKSGGKPLKGEEPRLRQKIFKAGTKKALRFRMMVMYPEMEERYYSLSINRSKLNEADKACHSAMMLILGDPVLFHDAAKNGVNPKTSEKSEFLTKLNIALNITNKNHTRRDEILNYAWDKLELYLEGLNIISEGEVTEFYKGFEETFPPGTDSKTIWKKIIS